jgi:hypothetical protein
VTRKSDSKAPKDELTFKCSISCPGNATVCQIIADATRVNWYSESSLIEINLLFYNNTTKQFYTFLNETIWTKFINTNVRIIELSLALDPLIT